MASRQCRKWVNTAGDAQLYVRVQDTVLVQILHSMMAREAQQFRRTKDFHNLFRNLEGPFR